VCNGNTENDCLECSNEEAILKVRNGNEYYCWVMPVGWFVAVCICIPLAGIIVVVAIGLVKLKRAKSDDNDESK